MEFIWGRALLSVIAGMRDAGFTECQVSNIDIARHGRPRALNEAGAAGNDAGERFTPGQFFKEAGTVVAACLVLGVLAQLLLG
jgi:hypothetical protein